MITAELIKSREGDSIFYTLKLQGGNEVTDDFRRIYESTPELYPNRHSYGVIGCQEQSTLELIIVCGEQRK